MLGEEHPDIAAIYNNLAFMHRKQGRYKIALGYYIKAYGIFLSNLGTEHPSTEIIYKNMQRAYFEWNPEGDFRQWLEGNLGNKYKKDLHFGDTR